MRFKSVPAIVLFSSVAVFAQAAGPKPADNFLTSMLPMLIAMFVIVWFLMIRPEQKKNKQRQKMLTEMKKGDKVQTIGGMIGTVGNVKDDSIMVKIAENTVVEFRKSAISLVLNAEGKIDDKKEEKK